MSAVDHPQHYGGDTTYETIKVLEDWMTPEQMYGFCVGNAIKYLSRAGKKGDLVEDLRKGRFYLDRAISNEEYRRSDEESRFASMRAPTAERPGSS